MKLKFDVFPDPIIVRGEKPEDDVKLMHAFLTHFERMRAIELIGSGISESMKYLAGFIKDWANVRQVDGTPLPFSASFKGSDGDDVPALDVFLSRISLSQQVELWATQLLLNGVSLKFIKPMFPQFLDEAGQSRIEAMIRPLSETASS